MTGSDAGEMSGKTKALPFTVFDHVVWALQTSDGTCRRAEILLGECLLLFTSMDSLQTYVNHCEDALEPELRPTVFSRSRKEFGRRAREAALAGIVGALFDPNHDHGEAPFLQFSRTDR